MCGVHWCRGRTVAGECGRIRAYTLPVTAPHALIHLRLRSNVTEGGLSIDGPPSVTIFLAFFEIDGVLPAEDLRR